MTLSVFKKMIWHLYTRNPLRITVHKEIHLAWSASPKYHSSNYSAKDMDLWSDFIQKLLHSSSNAVVGKHSYLPYQKTEL